MPRVRVRTMSESRLDIARAPGYDVEDLVVVRHGDWASGALSFPPADVDRAQEE